MPPFEPQVGSWSDTVELRHTGRYALAASIELAAKASFGAASSSGHGAVEPRVFDLALALEGD